MPHQLQITVSLIEKKADKEEMVQVLSCVARDLPEKPLRIEEIEQLVVEAGHVVRKEGFFRTLEFYDARLSQKRKHIDRDCRVTLAGKKPLVIASSVGREQMQRQRCLCDTCDCYFVPFNELLEDRGNLYITDLLKEMSLEQVKEASYRQSHKQVQLQTGDDQIISQRELEKIAVEAGIGIRSLEIAVAEKELEKAGVDAQQVRQMLGLAQPVEIDYAYDGVATPPLPQELQSSGEPEVPQEIPMEVQEDVIKASLDGVLVRKQRKRKNWIELAVGDVRDGQLRQFVSAGNWLDFVVKLMAVLLRWGADQRPVVLFVDGAEILKCVLETLRHFVAEVYMILDWYHLTKKCKERLSMACKGREHRKRWLKIIMPLLWEGQVAKAIWRLRALKQEARNPEQVQKLIAYLQRNQAFIPNYKRRKELGLTNGSHRAEKACDLLVSKRMKDEGMHWNEAGADAICALRTVSRNGMWRRFFAKKDRFAA